MKILVEETLRKKEYHQNLVASYCLDVFEDEDKCIVYHVYVMK